MDNSKVIGLVILDRDGVINQEHNDNGARILTPEQWQPIPGSIEAICRLNQAGFKVVVATNQSIIAKQHITETGLQKIHDKMHQAVRSQGGEIDRVFYCPHQDLDQCACRKPQPGLLTQIAAAYKLNFATTTVPFVGDAERDLLAAQACGAQPVLVLTGKGCKTYKTLKQHDPHKLLAKTKVFASLLEFADGWLLQT